MIELRDYQQEAISAVRGAYARGVRRQLVVLPTGGGKTIVFSSIIETAVAKGSDVLVLVHRDELAQQAEDKLLRVAPDLAFAVGWVKAERDEWTKPVVVASVQTLARERRLARLVDAGRRFSIVVVDEAHHAAADSYRRVLDALGCFEPETRILTVGVTATPQRADKRDLGDVFEEVVYYRDILSMMAPGTNGDGAALCNVRGIQVRLEKLDVSKLHVRDGDFIPSESEAALADADAPEHVVEAWQRHAKGRQTIVFSPTVSAAEQMADAFRAAGVAAVNASKEARLGREQRHAMLRDFSTGATTVLTNAQLLIEGFDEPDVGCVVVARPTRSQGLYVQMVGRGLRPKSDGVPYDDCVVLDVVGATDRMDLTVLPILAGMDKRDESMSDEDRKQVLDALADGGLLAAMEALEASQGRIIARRVEMFGARGESWVQVTPGVFALSLREHGTLVAEIDDAGKWRVVRHPKRDRDATVEPPAELLRDRLDQQTALYVGEKTARRFGVSRFVSRGASWRAAPASDSQRNALRRARIAQWRSETLTKGEASDLLATVIVRIRAGAR